MHPILFKIGSIPLYSYGFMMAVAFVVATFLASHEFKKKGLRSDLVFDLTIYLLIFGILGARLLHVLLNTNYYLNNLIEIFMLQRGGLAWQGGLVFGFIGGIFFIKRNNLKAGEISDLVMPYVALAQSIGRIGCYLNGCCYGRMTNCALGVVFPGMKVPVHPTQIYTSFFLLVIFIILKKKQEKKNFDWQVFSLYLVLHSLMRFSLDFIRGDLRIVSLGLKSSQFISLVLFLSGLVLYLVRFFNERKKRIRS